MAWELWALPRAATPAACSYFQHFQPSCSAGSAVCYVARSPHAQFLRSPDSFLFILDVSGVTWCKNGKSQKRNVPHVDTDTGTGWSISSTTTQGQPATFVVGLFCGHLA